MNVVSENCKSVPVSLAPLPSGSHNINFYLDVGPFGYLNKTVAEGVLSLNKR